MKNKGFTLIEIIICISLLTLVGTISIMSIIKLTKIKTADLLEKNSRVLNNALEVYLDKHPEITNNVNDNFEGAIVTLEVLKNDGLIDIKGLSKKEYKKNYFLLSKTNIVLSGKFKGKDSCGDNLLRVASIASWNVNTDEVVYICPTESNSVSEEIINKKDFVAKGENPNNYVEFKVNPTLNDSWSNWSNKNTNLWRIISIQDGLIKLVYSEPVETNNSYNYKSGMKTYTCRDNDWTSNYRAHNPESNEQGYCPLKVYCYGDVWTNDIEPKDGYFSGLRYSHYLKYSSPTIWTSSEIMSEYRGVDFAKTPNNCYSAKKAPLIDNIDSYYKKMIIENDYMYNFEKKEKVKLNLGFVTKDDYNSSLYNGKTYLNVNAYVYNFEKYYNATHIENFNSGKESWYSGCGFKSNITPHQNCSNYTTSDLDARFRFYIIDGIDYYPVITLDKKVEISIDKSCVGDTYGSVSCPYILKCDDCNNDPTIIN